MFYLGIWSRNCIKTWVLRDFKRFILNRFHLLVTGSNGRADLRLAWSSCRAARSGPAGQIALQRYTDSLPNYSAARHPAAWGLSQMNLSVASSLASRRGRHHVRWSTKMNSDRFDGYDDKPLFSHRIDRNKRY